MEKSEKMKKELNLDENFYVSGCWYNFRCSFCNKDRKNGYYITQNSNYFFCCEACYNENLKKIKNQVKI